MAEPVFTITPFQGGVTPSNASTFTATINYLISLIGKYIAQAQTIYGNATGTIVTPGGIPVPITSQYPINVTIDSAQANSTTFQDDAFKNSFGWNTLFINGGTYQLWTGLGSQPPSYFTINTSTGTLTFNYTLQLNDILTGLYFKSA